MDRWSLVGHSISLWDMAAGERVAKHLSAWVGGGVDVYALQGSVIAPFSNRLL